MKPSEILDLLQKLLEILTKSFTTWPLADVAMKQWMVLSCQMKQSRHLFK